MRGLIKEIRYVGCKGCRHIIDAKTKMPLNIVLSGVSTKNMDSDVSVEEDYILWPYTFVVTTK